MTPPAPVSGLCTVPTWPVMIPPATAVFPPPPPGAPPSPQDGDHRISAKPPRIHPAFLMMPSPSARASEGSRTCSANRAQGRVEPSSCAAEMSMMRASRRPALAPRRGVHGTTRCHARPARCARLRRVRMPPSHRRARERSRLVPPRTAPGVRSDAVPEHTSAGPSELEWFRNVSPSLRSSTAVQSIRGSSRWAPLGEGPAGASSPRRSTPRRSAARPRSLGGHAHFGGHDTWGKGGAGLAMR